MNRLVEPGGLYKIFQLKIHIGNRGEDIHHYFLNLSSKIGPIHLRLKLFYFY